MTESSSSPGDTATDQRSDDLSLTRRGALSLLAGSAVAGASSDGAATSSTTKTWQKDRDARGHDLLDAGTVEAASVTMEELDSDTLGPLDSLDIHDAALGHVHTGVREADRVVWKDDSGTFHADGPDGTVASGDFLTVTQAAIDSLSAGRTHKERVLVASPAVLDGDADSRQLTLPSYTVFDCPVTLSVEAGAALSLTAEQVDHIEVPNLTITGSVGGDVSFNIVSDVRLGTVALNSPGIAIRIGTIPNGSEVPRTEDVRIDQLYVEGSGDNAVETFSVDRCQIGRVIATNHAGCAVLFNDTDHATVGSIVGYNPDTSSSYATFRCANRCENVAVGQVVSRDAPRGVHVISDSDGVTIGEVAITGPRDHGIKVDRTVDNVSVQGGFVENAAPTAVLIQGGSVSISNLRVFDDRPEHERTQTHGIHVTHTARECRIVGNDVRRAGTEANILVDAPADDLRPTTTVRDNVGDGIASGSTVLQSGSSPAVRVEGVTDRKDVTLDLRANTVRGPADGEPFAWESYFEWNGDTDQWDLLFEWRTDPLENVEVEYVVDQPLANLGRVSKQIDHY